MLRKIVGWVNDAHITRLLDKRKASVSLDLRVSTNNILNNIRFWWAMPTLLIQQGINKLII
jgi:hypothetical protein